MKEIVQSYIQRAVRCENTKSPFTRTGHAYCWILRCTLFFLFASCAHSPQGEYSTSMRKRDAYFISREPLNKTQRPAATDLFFVPLYFSNY